MNEVNEQNNLQNTEHVNETEQVQSEQNTQMQEQPEERIDPATIEAEVIGVIKKERIGKPTLALAMIIIFVGIIFALPFINKMMNDENSWLYRVLNGVPINSSSSNPGNNQNKVEYLNGLDYQLVATSSNVKYENLIISNMYVKKDTLYAKLKSYNGLINLDEHQIYLEIYSNSKKLLTTIKLTGKLDFQEEDYELTNTGLLFNDTESYYIKIKEMKDGDFPTVSLATDESGIGTLTCTKEGRSIEYTFKNNYLINIKDKETLLKGNYTDNEYLSLIQKYREKSENLKVTETNVEENEEGFEFNALIDLEQDGYTIPSKVYDNNYYALDKEAKIISYEQTGKGFDCK